MKKRELRKPFSKKALEHLESLTSPEHYLNPRCVQIPVGEITEICGPSGSGKTYFLHRLAFSVGRQQEYHVIFFDFDHSFRPEALPRVSEEEKNVLSSIYTYPPLDAKDFLSKLRNLKKEFSSKLLLVVDSVTNLFAETRGDPSQRRGKMIKVGENLRKNLGESFTVVLSNQIRSTIKRGETQEKETDNFGSWRGDLWTDSGFLPALGRTWEHFIDNRIFFKRSGKKVIVRPVFSSGRKDEFEQSEFLLNT